MSNEQVEELSETIERLQKLKDCTEAEMDTLDKLWQLVYPDKTDWEYPGQVYRHVRLRMEEIEAERGHYKEKRNAVLADLKLVEANRDEVWEELQEAKAQVENRDAGLKHLRRGIRVLQEIVAQPGGDDMLRSVGIDPKEV